MCTFKFSFLLYMFAFGFVFIYFLLSFLFCWLFCFFHFVLWCFVTCDFVHMGSSFELVQLCQFLCFQFLFWPAFLNLYVFAPVLSSRDCDFNQSRVRCQRYFIFSCVVKLFPQNVNVVHHYAFFFVCFLLRGFAFNVNDLMMA